MPGKSIKPKKEGHKVEELWDVCLKQDWQVTRKTIEKPLFFMFSLSCWRALSGVFLRKFLPYCQYILAYTEFSLPESSSATSSCLVILFTWSSNESLSWNLCPIFKNKYNTNKRGLDCSHQPWPTRRCDCAWVNSCKISRLQFQRGPRHPGYSEEGADE